MNSYQVSRPLFCVGSVCAGTPGAALVKTIISRPRQIASLIFLLSVRASRVPSFPEFSTLKAEIGPHRCCTGLFQPRKERRLEMGHPDIRRYHPSSESPFDLSADS